ncbi:MAG TPA: serine hydrolase [Candidatus Limnocylindrales bacterium]|nr:serine hydrolase [Candidatus Limnocylindrales bacterium]
MPRRVAIAFAAIIVATAALVAGPALGPPGEQTAPTRPASPGVSDPPIASTPAPSVAPSPSVAPTPDVRVIARRPPTASPHLGARLQAQLDRLRVQGGVPGVSASIVFADGTTWTGSSGLADVATGTAVTPETGFSFASMTKSYVAALILALVAEGTVSLDDRAADLLPDIAIDERITIHQLLDHTSGLHDFFLDPTIDAALQGNRAAPWSVTQALTYVGRPYFAPGTGWRYSNTNYLLLGLIAERLTGTDLATALRIRFLDPLGLDHTWTQVAETPPSPTAHGYRFTGSATSLQPIDLSDGSPIMPFTSVVTAAGGAGSMAGTSTDAARWARLLYRGDVLGRDSLALMVGDVEVVAGYRPPVPYGLGVQAFVIDGRQTLGHSGRFLGFRGAMRYLVEDDVAIAVLTNQSRMDPGIIVRALIDIALPRLGPCTDCPVAD